MQRNTCQGNILIVGLVLIFVISGFVAAALNATNQSARMADRSRSYATAQAAAEGAVEYAYGVWKARILATDGPLTSSEAAAALTAPGFSGVSYATTVQGGRLSVTALDAYGAPMPNQTDYPTPVATDLISFPGWRGYTYNYLASAKLQNASNTYDFRVGVKRQFQYSAVPLFQSMYFFEHDLEIYHPAAMIVSGLIHTNGTAYAVALSGEPFKITGNLSYATGYTPMQDPPYANTWSGYAPSKDTAPVFPNGQANQTKQVSRIEPIGSDPATDLRRQTSAAASPLCAFRAFCGQISEPQYL